ncbi:hypothetical protein SAMN05216219_2597 [Mycetocola miduiensis]|uniref:Flavodoxin-like domain-containing protein n=1 Tax=Mycetocola miduiensis TaxID=995034 RepID=A0A1I5CW35_9MICO|nr:hypothetical protein SAMN05216219_2597 [Mycetocola miduiensis]
MHVVVVFESLWGNTERLAHEIAAGIGERTDVVDAATAPSTLDSDIELLVVGGPTHAFSMTTNSTRESASKQGAQHIPVRGIREWIQLLAEPERAVPVAAFDTRVVSPRLPGSAAKKAMKRACGPRIPPGRKARDLRRARLFGPDRRRRARARERMGSGTRRTLAPPLKSLGQARGSPARRDISCHRRSTSATRACSASSGCAPCRWRDDEQAKSTAPAKGLAGSPTERTWIRGYLGDGDFRVLGPFWVPFDRQPTSDIHIQRGVPV